jgi:GTP-binding protein
VDASGLSGREPIQDFEDLNYELKMYDESNQDKEGFFPLSTRPQFVVLNKIDTLSIEQLEKLKLKFKKTTGSEPLAISAVTGKNINELVSELGRQVLKDVE